MKTFLNYLGDFAAWAGQGDHFLGFVRIVVALIIVAVVAFVAIYINTPLSEIPG